MSSVNKLASGFVNSSLKDPRLSSVTAGKTVDAAAASAKVSDQIGNGPVVLIGKALRGALERSDERDTEVARAA